MDTPGQAPSPAQRSTAPLAQRRQLVLCLDGTSNTLTGRQRDTNVLRLHEALTAAERAGADAGAGEVVAEQLRYYDPGVGSPDALPVTGLSDWLSRKWERVAGLALGRGIYDNIGEAYRFLMQHWQPGTEVYLFGFSRGAFTARSVAGMVNLFGILKPEHEGLLQTLMRIYFAPPGRQHQVDGVSGRARGARVLLGVEIEDGAERTREAVAAQVRDSFARPESCTELVHFVGVWDTVSSVGLPGLSVEISSSSTVRGKRFRHVRHALSLDEHRHPFLPRLYAEPNFGDAGSTQSLQQLWFAGAHADAGGGYAPAESGLSDTAYRWMVQEAQACGLRGALHGLPPPAVPLLHDPLYTVPWWAIAGTTVRDSSQGGRVPAVAHPSADQTESLPSVWQARRSWPSLVLALGGALLAVAMVGYLAAGRPPQWGALPGDALDAAAAGMAMASYQMQLPWLSLAWLVDWFSTPDPIWVPRFAEHLGWATVFDSLFVASYAYVLARGVSWAVTRLAGRRRVGQPLPWWRPLGMALPLLVIADMAENLFTLALPVAAEGMAIWRVPLLVVAGLASWAKWVGFAGVLTLLVAGVFGPGTGHKAEAR